MRKVAWRLVPFLCILYIIAFIIRINVGFASLTMGEDFGLSCGDAWLGCRPVLHFLFLLRGSQQFDAAQVRRPALDCARHDQHGPRVHGLRLRPGCLEPLSDAAAARHRRGRPVPGHHLLHHLVVPQAVARARDRSLRRGDSGLQLHRRPVVGCPAAARRDCRSRRLAVDVHPRSTACPGHRLRHAALSDQHAGRSDLAEPGRTQLADRAAA